MLLSFALIFLGGLCLGYLFQKLTLPALTGMILTGIVLGPHAFNLLDPKVLSISVELRKIALMIILARAGLSLDMNSLKRVGRPAILMCFVPATFEILGMIIIAVMLLHISILEAAILGSVIAAVSPAVVVPSMLKIMDEGYGKKHSIPQLIMAGASVDDVYVIVMFTTFTSLFLGQGISIQSFINIPLSIVIGCIVGAMIGYLLYKFFINHHIRDSKKVLLFMSVGFLMTTFESAFPYIPFASLIAFMVMGMMIQKYHSTLAKRLSLKFNKLWVVAEIILFVLVGANVDVTYAIQQGFRSIILLLMVLLFRMLGVFICLLKTNLSLKERIFCMIAYCPKATVQAALASLPLSMGIPSGNIILTIAVVSILLTAPLGSFAIDHTYQHLLSVE